MFNNWLTDSVSRSALEKSYVLSNSLREYCKELKLELIQEGWDSCFEEEKAYLKPSTQDKNSPYWSRHICLNGDGQPFSFARALVPKTTFLAFEHQWRTLQNKFLGEDFIYLRKHHRSEFEYAQLNQQSELFKLLNKLCSLNTGAFLARRSIFTLYPKPEPVQFILTEVFLTNDLSYI
jgi:chorismate-pyruvate lyase